MNNVIDYQTDKSGTVAEYTQEQLEKIELHKHLYYIPTANTFALQDRLEQANKKAHKCLVAAGKRSKDNTQPVIFLKILGTHEKKLQEDGEKVLCFVCQLTGDLPTMEYEFVAKIEHIFDLDTKKWENIIRGVPGKSEEHELKMYRHYAPSCEHCHKERKRKNTYILRYKGELRQIGSKCLLDYTKNLSWKVFAELAEIMIEVGEECEESSNSYGSIWVDWNWQSTKMIDIRDYLAWVNMSIRKNGWLSKGNAYKFEKTATAVDAINEMNAYRKGEKWASSPNEKDYERVETVLTWIRKFTEEEVEKENDYFYNLYTTCKHNYLRYQHHGIVASVIDAYRRKCEDTTPYVPKTVSQYVGNVGDKITVTLKVTKETEIEGQFGWYTRYRLWDETNHNVFVYEGSNLTLEVGETYTITGKVKKQDEVYNIKQTYLKNCKIVK